MTARTRKAGDSAIAQRVRYLAQQGMARGEIARTIGCSTDTVYHYIYLARRHGIDIPMASAKGRTWLKRSVAMPTPVRDLLEPAAEARGMTPIELAEEILRKVAQDDLVDAVLDDGEDV